MPVGTTVLAVDVDEEAAAEVEQEPAGAAPNGEAASEAALKAAPTVARTSVLVGYGPPVESGARPHRRPRRGRPDGGVPAPHPPRDNHAVGDLQPEAPRERPRCRPPVRKLASDLGVDLTQVPGTGPDGLITREDVLGRAPQREERVSNGVAGAVDSAATPGVGHGPRETRTPISGVRKHTAAAMVASAFTAPHATEFLTVDVTAATELVEQLGRDRRFRGRRVTLMALVAKAVLVALRRSPSLNSRWDEANGEIVQFGYVNLGIAAATPRGLMVPNIKDADRLDLSGLVDALTELTQAARAGTTAPRDLSGGTISITNVGVFGIDAGTPILNPGEAAILAVGAVRRMPWEYRGEIALRDVMTLSLSFDHRLVDGEAASHFLVDVGAVLKNPGATLTLC